MHHYPVFTDKETEVEVTCQTAGKYERLDVHPGLSDSEVLLNLTALCNSTLLANLFKQRMYLKAFIYYTTVSGK